MHGRCAYVRPFLAMENELRGIAMQIEVLYGRAGSGKTHTCIDTIKSLLRAQQRCVMLVPEQFSYRTEKLLVAEIGAASSETAEALTFSRLAGRIFAQKSGAAKRPGVACGQKHDCLPRAYVG